MAQLDKIRLSGTTYDIVDATAVHSFDGYWTTGETTAAITAATNALAESIAEQGYQTSGDVQNAISGKADTTAVTAAIDAAVSGKANTSDVITEISGETSMNTWFIKQVKGGSSTTATLLDGGTGLIINTPSGSIRPKISIDNTVVAQKSDIPAVSGYADSVAYDTNTKYMKFYHGGTGGTEVFSFDASPFLIDGMVQNVEIKNVVGTQTFQTGYNSETSTQNPYFIASNYDTSATNAVGDCSNFRYDSSTGAKVLLKVFSSSGTETTVYNNQFTYNGTLPSSEYVTATYSNDTFTFVPAEGYRISTLNIFNVKDNDHMGMPAWNLCDLTVTAATTCLVITFNTDAGKQDINIPISQIFDASNYYTKSEVNEKINQSVSGKVSTYTYTAYTANTQTVLSGKADTTAVTQSITEATSGKADTTAVTAVNDALTAHTSNGDIHVTTSDKSTWSGKQDALVSGTNIKTVGGNSLLGSGDIAFPAGLQVTVSGTTLTFG